MENAFFFNFSGNFWVLWGVLKNSWLEIYKQLSSKYVCKYLNQRVRIVRKVNRMENSFEGVSKTNKKNPRRNWVSYLNSRWGFYYHNPQLNNNHWNTRQLSNICSILFLIYRNSSQTFGQTVHSSTSKRYAYLNVNVACSTCVFHSTVENTNFQTTFHL